MCKFKTAKKMGLFAVFQWEIDRASLEPAGFKDSQPGVEWSVSEMIPPVTGV
jgi:hypothetical protein